MKEQSWYQRNREKVLEQKRIERHANPEVYRQRSRDYRKRNPEKVAKTNKKLRSDPEKAEKYLAKAREYKSKNREKVNEYTRKYWLAHPEKRSFYESNRIARKKAGGGSVSLSEWNEILDKYGHKCLCCKRDDVKLVKDHVFPLKLGGRNTADNIQPLCSPCNRKKWAKYIDYRI